MLTQETFGQYLKNLLTSRDIKPQELADKLNIDHSLVRKWLSGSRVPSLKSNYHDLLCTALNLNQSERLLLKRAQLYSIDENIVRLTDSPHSDLPSGEYEQAIIALLDAMTEGAFLLDSQAIILYANEATARRIHLPLTALVGQEIYQFLPPASAETWRLHLQNTIQLGQPVKFKDYRSDSCILNSFYPVKDANGHTAKIAVSESDITDLEKVYDALRESEERHRLLFEYSLYPILLTRPNGDITAANPAACAFFQMTEEELRARGRDGIVDLTDPNLTPFLTERQTTGKSRRMITHIKKDGTKEVSEITTAQFIDSKGELVSYIILQTHD